MSDPTGYRRYLQHTPADLNDGIREFFPLSEWDNAASISWLESKWNPFAENDTRTTSAKCGEFLRYQNGIVITAEWSIGYFQINACNLPPGWNPSHLFNTRHNVGTAHEMWAQRGWEPWLLSAQTLGLL